MMELLVASNVLLWIFCIALVLVNYALIRQIGVLYERVAPAGALAINKTLAVGDAAPKHQIQSINAGLVRIGEHNGHARRAQLLFFLSPDCPVCKTLLPALKSAAKSESDWVDLVLVSDGPEQDHQAYITRYGLEGFPYLVSEAVGKSCGVSKLPYGVLIDEYAKIASLGIVNSREHIDSLFEAKEQNIASLQQYLQSKSTQQQAAKKETTL